jgi:hypothetical protein
MPQPAKRNDTRCGIGRGIAQPGRALPSGGRGRKFESCFPDQIFVDFLTFSYSSLTGVVGSS